MKRVTMTPKILAFAIAGLAAVPATASSAADFDFYGYYRANVGTATEGGDQVCYKADGAGSKYRLGNECDNYYEAGMKGELYNENGRSIRIDTMLGGSDTSDKGIELIQVAIMGDNMVDALPGATIWAGKRYYLRRGVHMSDYKYLNTSGNGGAGIENIDLGGGKKFSAAWVENKSGAAGDVHNNALDVRVADIEIAGGKLLAGVVVSAPNLTDAQEAAGEADNGGSLVTLDYSFGGGENGFNNLVLQYANDGLAGTSGSNDNTMEGTMVRALSFGLMDLSDTSELEYNLLYQNVENGAGENQTWVSAGVRPTFHWNDVASTAVEIGYDSVSYDEGAGTDNSLTKITVAQQWAAGDGYWSRPLIRAYATHASGSKIAIDGVNNNSTSLGVQAEVWW